MERVQATLCKAFHYGRLPADSGEPPPAMLPKQRFTPRTSRAGLRLAENGRRPKRQIHQRHADRPQNGHEVRGQERMDEPLRMGHKIPQHRH